MPTTGAPSWSTDVHTNAHAPLGRSVNHVLVERVKKVWIKNMKSEENRKKMKTTREVI